MATIKTITQNNGSGQLAAMSRRLDGRPNTEPTERRQQQLGTLESRLPLLGGEKRQDGLWTFRDGSQGNFQRGIFVAIE